MPNIREDYAKRSREHFKVMEEELLYIAEKLPKVVNYNLGQISLKEFYDLRDRLQDVVDSIGSYERGWTKYGLDRNDLKNLRKAKSNLEYVSHEFTRWSDLLKGVEKRGWNTYYEAQDARKELGGKLWDAYDKIKLLESADSPEGPISLYAKKRAITLFSSFALLAALSYSALSRLPVESTTMLISLGKAFMPAIVLSLLFVLALLFAVFRKK